jgi:hypothetical protein
METQQLLVPVGGSYISAEDRSLYSGRDKSSLCLKVTARICINVAGGQVVVVAALWPDLRDPLNVTARKLLPLSGVAKLILC